MQRADVSFTDVTFLIFSLVIKLLQIYNKYDVSNKIDRPVDLVVKDIDVGVIGLGFDSRTGQIGHKVANDSPPLQSFFGAVLSRR